MKPKRSRAQKKVVTVDETVNTETTDADDSASQAIPDVTVSETAASTAETPEMSAELTEAVDPTNADKANDVEIKITRKKSSNSADETTETDEGLVPETIEKIKLSSDAENANLDIIEVQNSADTGETINIVDPKSTKVSETIKMVVDVPEIPVSNTKNEATPMANQSPTTPPNPDGNFEDWVIMPETSWPPPIFMKKNVAPRERFYLEYRWHSQWSYYDSKATQNKNTYYYLQRIVVIGALIIPALVSLASTIARFLAGLFNSADATAEAMWRIGIDSITIAISLLVAGAAALESLYKFGENWTSYRSAAEELQAEKNFYDMSAGPYAASANPFATFVERVEGIVANQNGKYFQAVQQQLQKQADENEEIVASFKSGGDDDDDEYQLSVQHQSTASPETDAG